MPSIPKGKSDATFTLDVSPKTPLGENFVTMSAKAKSQGKENALSEQLLFIVTPLFDLHIEPGVISLKPGEMRSFKVTAIRRGGYQGPIALDVRKLPAMVTAAGKPVIPADASVASIDLTAAAAAAPGDAPAVEIVGTATGLNNAQATSPPFTVRVQKK
jgi:hypothetical protein